MTEQLKQALIREGFRQPDEFDGCTDEEIQYVMKCQNIRRLPATFIEYLKLMGHRGIIELFRGEDADYDSMIGLKKSLQSGIRASKSQFILPSDAFVFFGHHDDDFKYFLTNNDDDNPPIYMYVLESDDSYIVAQNFTEYLDAILGVFRKIQRRKGNMKH